ncbi:MAG: phospholipase, partial [Gemmatimonadetes bacterium]|nr:phospholipase [Gemmatimonadota bacterium]
LAARARDGVRVRVMTDWLGSFGTSRRFWRGLRQAGVEVRLFGPPDLWNLRRNLTRNHRKLVVVDGEWAVTGGWCIGDEWAGDPARDRQPWRDTGVVLDGPAAAVLDQAFGLVWGRIGTPLPPDELVAEVPERGDAEVRVLAGEPGGARASSMLELLLAAVQERVWITDAYLVAPRGLFRSLLDAARQGVDVRLLVPGTSDLPHIRNLTRTGYRDLLESGVRIFEWRGSMLHAKSVVADGRWVRIGSTNLNLSSLIANYELDILIENEAFAQQMEAQFRRDLDHSVEVRYSRRPLFRDSIAFQVPDGATDEHRPGFRERRRRAVVALRAAISGSERVLFLQRIVGLAVLAVLLLVFPRATGLVLGLLVVWVALTTVVDAVVARRRNARLPAGSVSR